MWDIFHLPYTIDKTKKWDLFKNKSILPLYYVKETLSDKNSDKSWAEHYAL